MMPGPENIVANTPEASEHNIEPKYATPTEYYTQFRKEVRNHVNKYPLFVIAERDDDQIADTCKAEAYAAGCNFKKYGPTEGEELNKDKEKYKYASKGIFQLDPSLSIGN